VQRAEQLGTGVPSLRLFVCGGASVPPNLIYSAHRVLGEGQEGELVVRGAVVITDRKKDLIIRGGESQCQGDRGHPARPLRCSHT